MQRRSYCNTVFPTVHTRIGGVCASSLYSVSRGGPDGVVSSQGCSFVPLASAIVTSSFLGCWSVFSIIYWSLQYVKQSNWWVSILAGEKRWRSCRDAIHRVRLAVL